MLALHKLQDRVCIHTSREEEESAQGVGRRRLLPCARRMTDSGSAKYIEGLENRLGRMESLLKMSGLLTEEEAGRTDLGTLEKRLADKASSTARGESPKPTRSTSSAPNTTDSQQGTPGQETQSSPQDSAASPATDAKDDKKREEVENLSDMMCSLVTNNIGETRYIGVYSRANVLGQ